MLFFKKMWLHKGVTKFDIKYLNENLSRMECCYYQGWAEMHSKQASRRHQVGQREVQSFCSGSMPLVLFFPPRDVVEYFKSQESSF